MTAPALVHAPVRSRTLADLKRAKAARALLPDRDTLRKRYPKQYREEFNPESGKVEWVINVPLRDLAGKRTQESHDLADMLGPYARCSARKPEPEPGQRLIDAKGNSQYVNPALADVTRHRTGWRLPRQSVPMETGPDGMLFRFERRWEPTGRWCLGTPFTQGDRPEGGRRDGSMICRGIQTAPDGTVWRGLGRLGWAVLDPPRLVRRKR